MGEWEILTHVAVIVGGQTDTTHIKHDYDELRHFGVRMSFESCKDASVQHGLKPMKIYPNAMPHLFQVLF